MRLITDSEDNQWVQAFKKEGIYGLFLLSIIYNSWKILSYGIGDNFHQLLLAKFLCMTSLWQFTVSFCLLTVISDFLNIFMFVLHTMSTTLSLLAGTILHNHNVLYCTLVARLCGQYTIDISSITLCLTLVRWYCCHTRLPTLQANQIQVKSIVYSESI